MLLRIIQLKYLLLELNQYYPVSNRFTEERTHSHWIRLQIKTKRIAKVHGYPVKLLQRMSNRLQQWSLIKKNIYLCVSERKRSSFDSRLSKE